MTNVEAIFDSATFTMTYVVFDAESRDAIIVDPVLDYDPVASQTSAVSAEKLIDFVTGRDLNVRWILETHAHADHLSSAQILKKRLEAPVAIGERITVVQQTFKHLFDLPDLAVDGSQFDKLIKHGEVLDAGSFEVEAIATPGHTPACMSFKVGNRVFVGDALFMPDFGTGRCDFPKGSAKDLYASVVNHLYTLPDDTRVFVGHDYQPNGRELQWETTIGACKQSNKQLRADTSEAKFVEFRKARDATLSAPKLLFQSVQVNVDAGIIPKPHGNEIRYLRLPLNLFGPTDDFGVPS